MKRVLLLLILLVSVTFVSATNTPRFTGYVNDYASLLTAAEKQSLEQSLASINENSSVEVAIALVPNTEGRDTASYAVELANENGVGKKAEDNGVLILWSADNIKGGFIATGRGIGDVLTDVEVSRLGRQARPLFDQGRYYDGLNIIVQGIQEKVNQRYTPQDAGSATPWWAWIFFGFFILIFLTMFITIIVVIVRGVAAGGKGNNGHSKSFRSSSYIGSSMGGFHGGSGGFGGFGGGSFGGGGGRF